TSSLSHAGVDLRHLTVCDRRTETAPAPAMSHTTSRTLGVPCPCASHTSFPTDTVAVTAAAPASAAPLPTRIAPSEPYETARTNAAEKKGFTVSGASQRSVSRAGDDR